MAGALYGLFLGTVFLVVSTFVPQPAAAMIVWGFVSIQLAWFAVVVWRLTRLPFVTAAAVHGAVMSLCLVILAIMGEPFPNLARGSLVLITAGALVTPLLMLIESRVNHPKWDEWGRCMKRATVWDILTGRHIPHLQ